MIYELKPEEFNKVSHLFREREIAGAHFVLNGIEKGYVLVDNISNPSIAAVIEYNSCYLDGDYSNTKFVETLIKRNIKEIDIMTAWVLNESKDTNPLLKMLNESIEYEQLNYELNELKFDWRENLPTNCEIRKIDKNLLNNNFENSDDILAFIDNNFNNSVDQFLEKSGGFCLITNNKILSSSILLHNYSTNSYNMWIRTINDFQKKGYGTIVAAATTEYCLSLGSQMRWTTDDYNIGSIKIAEKIGHSLKKKSKVYFLYSDNFINCLENFTRHKYVTKNYMNAISFLNKMFNLRDQTNNKYLWCTNNKYSNAGYNSFSYLLYYYELSQLYELKRDPANAIKYIDKAIYLGRNDPEQLEHVINKNDDPLIYMITKREKLIKDLSKKK